MNDSLKVLSNIAKKEYPKMMYGTAWKKQKTTDLVVEAVLTGFRWIDTACQPKHYQEDLVGKAIEKLEKEHGIPRTDLFIQTKFTSLDGQDPNKIPYDKSAELKEQVRQSFIKSLENLKTDYLDSLVMHSPMKTFEKTMQVWETFEEFYKNGKVHYLGISNIYNLNFLKQIYLNANIKPAVIQNRFYADTSYDKALRAFCKENGIVYQSFWTLTANPFIVNSKEVTALASKYTLTNEQVFFKFVSQLGISPLTGTCTKEHMKQDLEVLNIKDLLPEELRSIGKYINEDL